MAEFTYDFEAVQRITASAVGPPGQRVFYIQARRGTQVVSIFAEKEQVRALADAIGHLLDDLAEKNPLLSTSDDMLVMDMSLEEPVEPAFRVVQMGLGYDSERDMVVLVVQGQPIDSTGLPSERLDALSPSLPDEEDEEDGDVLLARLSATRPQMRALSLHAARVVAAGRPICGNCGRPIDPTGHFCPERNGHGPVYA